ncbi:MAG: hypothetical protein EB003_09380 [Flavobacteriia bacterium]|nr:hypothetical protein [Flavobacteriia bacterium]
MKNLVRYIRIEKSNPNTPDYLLFNQIVAYDKQNTNVALLKPSKSSTAVRTNTTSEKAVNGQIQNVNNYFMSDLEPNGFWEVDLNNPTMVSRILFYNVVYPLMNISITKFKLKVMNSNRETISEFPLADQSIQEFTIQYPTSKRELVAQKMADLLETETKLQRAMKCLDLEVNQRVLREGGQKVVEEAPSAVLTPAIRQQMGEAAVAVCKACNYEGAGTVEFLIDAGLNFYFLEMNTRLQVEHPVTEEITGLDLVEWQIRVARGERLPKLQDELQINGHAIEVRVYAEDTLGGFTPDIGTLDRYRIPSGRYIRVDDAFEEGMEIPIYYDPMIAKLVVWGKTREEAIERCISAIDNYQISGVKTTLDFGKFVLKHPAFRSGHFDTNFVKTHFSDPALLKDAMQEEERALVYALDTIWQDIQAFKKAAFASRDITSSWKNQIR